MGKPFGEILRNIRIKCRITLKALADFLKMTPAYLSQIETGKRNPPNEVIVQEMEEFLHTQPGTLKEAAIHDKILAHLGLSRANPTKADVAFQLARDLDSISDRDIAEIKEILEKNRKGRKE